VLFRSESEIFCCKFSPDGNFMASAGFDRKIFLWNVYGECENWAVMMGHSGAVMDLKFAKDSTEVVTCATDKSIMIWDIQVGERVKKYKGHTGYVNSVDVSRQMPQLICSGGDDNNVKVWDRRKKGEVMNFDSTVQVLAVSFNDTADQVITSGIDNDIKVWDTRKKALLYRMKGHTDCPTGLSLSPDGAYVASNAMDSTVRIWDIRPFASQERCTKIFYGHTHNFEKNLLRVAWSPDGLRISAGSADKFLYIWDAETTKISYKLPGHLGSVNDVDFHPMEPIIASASSDKKIFLGEI